MSTPRLPSEYQEVEYIVSREGSYINLGAKSWKNPGFKGEVLITRRVNQYGPHVVSSINRYMWCVPRSLASGMALSLKGSDTGNIKPIAPLNKRLLLKVNDTGNANYLFDWGTSNASGTANVGTTTSTTKMTLFCYADQMTQSYYHLVGNCYYIELYDNGVKVMDLIPCYRKSDNKVGLYDIIGNSFYSSSGSAQFTAGTVVN